MLSTGASVAVVRFDGPTSRLVLHAGYQDPGGEWFAGSQISQVEQSAGLRGAFNGGFRLNVGAGGFFEGGRSAASLVPGDASVVTYSDGTTDIGAWGREVPAPGKMVVSVRQNLQLLVDNGQLASDVDQYGPWGATLGGGFAVARSALGIDRFGNLLWAGSSYSTPRALGTALITSGAVRALQLDINPEWVAGFFFAQGQQRAVLPSQSRPFGTFLSPYSRDFFVVIAR
jgi:hypothetical protein